MNKSPSPLVSIIMPAYNAEQTISKAISSVLRQDFKNIELIVVNDGSIDATVDTCMSFTDSRLRIINQCNLGLSEARNTGLRAAVGEYITFIDSDDWVDENFISLLVKNAQKTLSELAICGIIKEHSTYTQQISFKQASTYNNCLDNISFLSLFEGGLINSCCNKLYLRGLIIENNLFFSGKALVEDIEFNISYLQLVQQVQTIEECPYHYQMNSNSLTSLVSEDMIKNYMDIQKQLLGVLKKENRIIANRFVFHQYFSIFLKYLRKVAFKKLNAKDVFPILDNYLNEPLICNSFDNYNPETLKEKIILFFLKRKFYYPIIIYMKFKL